MKSNRLLTVLSLLLVVIVGAWAVENQAGRGSSSPADFNPKDPKDYPVLTDIDINIRGLADIGKVFMLEGIENTTSVEFSGNSFSPGRTSYPRLVLHGVFEKIMRDWRDEVISGKATKRDIELDLNNQAGKRVLRVTFHDAFPVSFSLPPFSVDNNTRYMERLEFIYTDFEITN